MTPAGGEAIFERLRQDSYRIQIELDETGKKTFELETAAAQHALDMSKNPDELVFWVRLVIHLRLKYEDPDAVMHHFPKDFPVQVVFDDATTKDLKVLDDEGYFKFEIEDDKKKKFTLKFDSGKARYLVHPVRGVPGANATAPNARTDAPKTKIFEDPTDDQLREWTTGGKKFFALPKTWSLVHSHWDALDVTIPQDGQIEVKEGVGAADKPAELTLKPKFQHVRFEFHDRKYGPVGEAHDGKRVSIPPIVLKGSRESNDAGAPVNPISGTHDTISNWQVKPDDAEKACQVLPWIILKRDDDTDLPKFNNKMLLEFGWENGFVHSAGKAPADCKIVVLPADDPKRKPGKDRPQFYDLPKVWKSKYDYTRLSSSIKNKFFDKFLDADDPDLDASLAANGVLSFSLDDIVLVDRDGKQETIKDHKESGDPVDLSENSRFTILELDRQDKKFNVKVYEDKDSKYWSSVRFVAEGSGGARRNVIARYPVSPRAVVFCSEFHDIFDKRTEAADCTDKKILGARAAKIEDTDVSSKKVLLKETTDVDKAYVGYKSSPRIHYLHYWEVDGSTVYGAIVTYWSARFTPKTSKGGTDAHVTLFGDKGLALAMKRWNDKDYYFEENDDKTELRIKHFCLFEAKGVETGPGAFTDTGGKHVCLVKVRDDQGGSSALNDGSGMTMRASGAKDEGESWGDPPVRRHTLPGLKAATPTPSARLPTNWGIQPWCCSTPTSPRTASCVKQAIGTRNCRTSCAATKTSTPGRRTGRSITACPMNSTRAP